MLALRQGSIYSNTDFINLLKMDVIKGNIIFKIQKFINRYEFGKF